MSSSVAPTDLFGTNPFEAATLRVHVPARPLHGTPTPEIVREYLAMESRSFAFQGESLQFFFVVEHRLRLPSSSPREAGRRGSIRRKLTFEGDSPASLPTASDASTSMRKRTESATGVSSVSEVEDHWDSVFSHLRFDVQLLVEDRQVSAASHLHPEQTPSKSIARHSLLSPETDNSGLVSAHAPSFRESTATPLPRHRRSRRADEALLPRAASIGPVRLEDEGLERFVYIMDTVVSVKSKYLSSSLKLAVSATPALYLHEEFNIASGDDASSGSLPDMLRKIYSKSRYAAPVVPSETVMHELQVVQPLRVSSASLLHGNDTLVLVSLENMHGKIPLQVEGLQMVLDAGKSSESNDIASAFSVTLDPCEPLPARIYPLETHAFAFRVRAKSHRPESLVLTDNRVASLVHVTWSCESIQHPILVEHATAWEAPAISDLFVSFSHAQNEMSRSTTVYAREPFMLSILVSNEKSMARQLSIRFLSDPESPIVIKKTFVPLGVVDGFSSMHVEVECVAMESGLHRVPPAVVEESGGDRWTVQQQHSVEVVDRSSTAHAQGEPGM